MRETEGEIVRELDREADSENDGGEEIEGEKKRSNVGIINI